MVMVVVMIVMIAGRVRDGRLGVMGLSCRWFWSGGFERGRLLEGNAASGAETVLGTIERAANLASAASGGFWGNFGHGGFLCINLERQSLNGLQSGGDSLLAGLGMAHVVAQAGKELINGGILGEFTLGPARRCRIRGSWFLVRIHSCSTWAILDEKNH